MHNFVCGYLAESPLTTGSFKYIVFVYTCTAARS